MLLLLFNSAVAAVAFVFAVVVVIVGLVVVGCWLLVVVVVVVAALLPLLWSLYSPLPLVLMFFKLEKIRKKENAWKLKKQNFKTEKTGSTINREKKERQKG